MRRSLLLLLLSGAACGASLLRAAEAAPGPALAAPENLLAQDLIAAARARTERIVRYDGAYRRLAYPNGDVPDDVGVCTDLIVRAYRAVDVDLQRLVHEDMRADFAAYPKHWGLQAPDANIDHRRVPNLERFFERQGAQRTAGSAARDYRPGDLVTWRLAGGAPHIGLVSDRRSHDGERRLIIHNIGEGPREEDVLFAYRLQGHYRWLPEELER